MNFERLKDIRETLELSQRELASKLKISKSTVSRWETGEKIIPLKHLISLCNLAKVSLDYALGISNKNTKNFKAIVINKENISKKIILIRKRKGLTQEELAQLLNTTQSTISSYENAKTTILTAFLYDISIRFNVSVDWFLE